MPRHKIVIRVPATTANLGPGFDCLGMALDIYNTVAVDRDKEPGVDITGEGAQHLARNADNLVCRAFTALFQQAGQPAPPVLLSCHNDIPLSRGLGSSAAAIVGGLMAGNALLDAPLSTQQLLELGARLEGHADNIAPALLGGCQVVVTQGNKTTAAAIPLPPQLKVVLFIPDLFISTSEARALLPDAVKRQDAVHNLGRVALLVLALTTGQLDYLRIATQDMLHQPARTQLFPAMPSIFQAALDAGALAVFLSGAGPTVLALTVDNEETIAAGMLDAAAQLGVTGRVRLTRPSITGARQTDA